MPPPDSGEAVYRKISPENRKKFATFLAAIGAVIGLVVGSSLREYRDLPFHWVVMTLVITVVHAVVVGCIGWLLSGVLVVRQKQPPKKNG